MYEPGNRSQFATFWICHLEKLILLQELLLALVSSSCSEVQRRSPF